jgi:hypothetical protein
VKARRQVTVWREIYEVRKSCGAVNGEECTYIGDVIWPNLRKITKVSVAYSCEAES